MATFKSISENEKNDNWNKIFNILAEHEKESVCTEDGASEIVLDSGELTQIRDAMYDEVRNNLGEVQSVEEMRKSLVVDTKKLIKTLYQKQDKN